MSDFNGDDLYRNPSDGQQDSPERGQDGGQSQNPYGNPGQNQNPYGNSGQEQNPYSNSGQEQNQNSGQEQNPWQYPPQNPYSQSGFHGYNQGGNQNPYYTVPGYGQGQPQPPYKKKNTMAVFSMISGIFSIVACCASPLAVILGITGIVLAILSKKGQPMDGFAIAGIVLSIVGLVVSLAFFAYYIFILSLMKNPEYASFFNELLEQYQMVQ